MKERVELSESEKTEYCKRLTEELAVLRKRLGQTQEELESVCGISRVTLSQIESGRCRMSWLHFASLMQVFTQNREVKELLYVRGLMDERLLRAYQHLPLWEDPDFNAEIPEPESSGWAKPEQDQDDN